MSRLDLTPLFEPKGVVVAGASSHPGKFGFVALHNIVAGGYRGRVFATNRDEPEILGVQSTASIESVPDGQADLVMVCAPGPAIPTVLRESAAKGIRAAFVVTGGFGELGDEGRANEAELVDLAADLGIVLAGPNGQGLVSTPIDLCCQIVAPNPPRGSIGVASQSGNLVSTVLNLSRQANIGISRAVSAGNQAMVGIADYIDYLSTDRETSVIIAYVEGVPDGRQFYEAVRAAASTKPVIVVKGGATAEGAEAASSHTGSLATNDRVFDGMLRQAGAIRRGGMDEAFHLASGLAAMPAPAGPRTVVLTTAGGWGVLTTDALAHSSLELIALPPTVEAAIDELVPPRWSRQNPVDLAGGETRDTIPDALEAIANDGGVDAIIYLGLGIQGNTARAYRESPFAAIEGVDRMASFHERQEARYADAAVAASRVSDKPIAVASELAVADPSNPGIARLRDHSWPCFGSPREAVAVLDAMWRFNR
ncbi:MAG: CoA-binding protein [Acidimicrobiales bacterium]